MLSHAFTLVLGIVLGLWSAHRANKRLAADLKREQSKLDDFRRELHHAGVSIARRDDEIDVLNARLLEANAELVLLLGDDDMPPEAA
jgi:hypothetical protein